MKSASKPDTLSTKFYNSYAASAHLANPMLTALAIANYRSIRQLTLPLGRLNLVVGPNGSGKSSLYRALRLLAASAQGGIVTALAREGGLQSTLWAGPEQVSGRMRRGEVAVQGGPRQERVHLRMGFAGEEFGYLVDLGLPTPSASLFAHDPEIKRECIFNGPFLRPASLLVDRKGPMVRVRAGRSWEVVQQHLAPFDSMLAHGIDPRHAPELFVLREQVRAWRFYDHFRTDGDAPPRHPQIATRTPALSHDGHDLAAALATIREVGDSQALESAIADAFPGSELAIAVEGGRFSLQLQQHGLLRPLTAGELSDGTLRYLLWVAALLTPRPPPLMVLNEPETSLHPDLLPALARLIINAAERTQVWVVSHAGRLINTLEGAADCHTLRLEKELGETRIDGLGMLDEPPWHWPER